ncbi:hypothetical protein [Kitasatospora sp. NPDC002965]|uniref:hypothetical protein n=1 Tax=Kitasatospora sp. NPDC002965 TaxID=3154775 RepID=UPI0033B0F669
MTTSPTPRGLAHIVPGPRPSVTTSTATVLGTFRTELLAAGLPDRLADELVLATGKALVHTVGLTIVVPNLLNAVGGVPTFATLDTTPAKPTTCRCARTRSTEGR